MNKNRLSSIVNRKWWLCARCIAVLITSLFVVKSSAQKISATLDRDKIVIGEQVTLELKVSDVNPRLSFLASWFSFPDSVNHLAIIKKDAIDTVDVGGLATYLQHITITSFDSGRWAIPLPPVIIQDRTSGKKTSLKADSVFLQVLSADVSGLKDYHDIKDIIDVPKETDYTLIIAAGISVVVITVLLILLLKRKKSPLPVAKKQVKNARPPLEEALYKLNELEKEGLAVSGQSKLFFITLDDICREYFANRLNIHVTELTSDELLPMMGVYLQDQPARARYKQLLQLTDSVKFAKYKPAVPEHADALRAAAVTLQYIDGQIQISTGHVK